MDTLERQASANAATSATGSKPGDRKTQLLQRRQELDRQLQALNAREAQAKRERQNRQRAAIGRVLLPTLDAKTTLGDALGNGEGVTAETPLRDVVMALLGRKLTARSDRELFGLEEASTKQLPPS
jgi:hypothetical protein